jgi:hypothetical protein
MIDKNKTLIKFSNTFINEDCRIALHFEFASPPLSVFAMGWSAVSPTSLHSITLVSWNDVRHSLNLRRIVGDTYTRAHANTNTEEEQLFSYWTVSRFDAVVILPFTSTVIVILPVSVAGTVTAS